MPKSTHYPSRKINPSVDPKKITDPRFSSLNSDPRYKLPSRKRTHVTLDSRFAHMLKDEEFSGRAKVDRYGRRLPKSAGGKELERYYRLDEQDGEEEEEEGKVDAEVGREMRKLGKDEVEEGDEEQHEQSSSEDSESNDNSDSDSQSEEEEEVFGLLEGQGSVGEEGIPRGEVSRRLAVVNLDWDHIRASDLMAVFSSFVPSGGRLLKISVYPSEFGRERMDKEEMEGPPKEIFSGVGLGSDEHRREEDDEGEEVRHDEDEDEDVVDEGIKKSIIKEDEGLEFNSAKLRRYQLERLRYFYAVITCSAPSVAQTIYDAVDGTEYLTTANFFDLRYVPEDITFSNDEPRDECERIPDGYRPNEFVTDALQHSKVRLTWDADDGERKEAQKRAFKGGRKDVDENDLKAYLGSDSSEDEEEAPRVIVVDATNPVTNTNLNGAETEEAALPNLSRKEVERQKMRALLGLAAEPTPKKAREGPVVGDMQVTFSSGLNTNGHGSVFENTPEEAQETTVERYVRKEKERKARRKEKSKAARTGGVEADNAATSEQSNKADADLGFNDPFFETTTTKKEALTASRAKASKREKWRQREAEEAAAVAAAAIPADQPSSGSTATFPKKTIPGEEEISHFDIKALSRASKLATKKAARSKKHKLTARDVEALEAKARDTFEMDVGDERFRDVFERNEFAIDPSHPRFAGTEGMKRLLEEGRRDGDHEDTGDGDRVGRKRKMPSGEDGGGDEMGNLVKRVKTKVREGAGRSGP